MVETGRCVAAEKGSLFTSPSRLLAAAPYPRPAHSPAWKERSLESHVLRKLNNLAAFLIPLILKALERVLCMRTGHATRPLAELYRSDQLLTQLSTPEKRWRDSAWLRRKQVEINMIHRSSPAS